MNPSPFLGVYRNMAGELIDMFTGQTVTADQIIPKMTPFLGVFFDAQGNLHDLSELSTGSGSAATTAAQVAYNNAASGLAASSVQQAVDALAVLAASLNGEIVNTNNSLAAEILARGEVQAALFALQNDEQGVARAMWGWQDPETGAITPGVLTGAYGKGRIPTVEEQITALWEAKNTLENKINARLSNVKQEAYTVDIDEGEGAVVIPGTQGDGLMRLIIRRHSDHVSDVYYGMLTGANSGKSYTGGTYSTTDFGKGSQIVDLLRPLGQNYALSMMWPSGVLTFESPDVMAWTVTVIRETITE